MGETLKIANFAGIKEITLEPADFTILIGSNASGKSVCAKLLFFCRDILSQLISTADSISDIRIFKNKMIERFFSYFPRECCGSSTYSIYYSNGGFRIKLIFEFDKLRLSLSDVYSYVRNDFRSSSRIIKKGFIDTESESSAVRIKLNQLESKFFSEYDVSIQTFIPAVRAFFAFYQQNLYKILSSQLDIDPFTIEFGAFYERIRDFYFKEPQSKRKFSLNRDLINSFNELLCAPFIYSKEGEFFQYSDGRRTTITKSSSSQQELLPLATALIIIDMLTKYKSRRRNVYIEEPETHLFPENQKQLMELLIKVFNKSEGYASFFITTHSPYLLTTINNSLLAYKAANNTDDYSAIERIIAKDMWLDSIKVRVYMIKDGKEKNILNEDGLIAAGEIDEVSDKINNDFNKLLYGENDELS